MMKLLDHGVDSSSGLGLGLALLFGGIGVLAAFLLYPSLKAVDQEEDSS